MRSTSGRALLLAYAAISLLAYQLAGLPQPPGFRDKITAFAAVGRGVCTRNAAAYRIMLRALHVRGAMTCRTSSAVTPRAFPRPRACRPFRSPGLALRGSADQGGAGAEGNGATEPEEALSLPLAAGDYARVLDDAPGWDAETSAHTCVCSNGVHVRAHAAKKLLTRCRARGVVRVGGTDKMRGRGWNDSTMGSLIGSIGRVEAVYRSGAAILLRFSTSEPPPGQCAKPCP
jgi:hypothetical protein